jgi:hypothetical protein
VVPQLDFGKPEAIDLIFYGLYNLLDISLGDTTNPVDLTGATVLLTATHNGQTLFAYSSPATITVTPQSPTLAQSRIQCQIQQSNLEQLEGGFARYTLVVQFPGAEPWNLLAGKFQWRPLP